LRGDESGANFAAKLVRMGMFCRFGLLELNRPVSVMVWLNEACRRLVRGL